MKKKSKESKGKSKKLLKGLKRKMNVLRKKRQTGGNRLRSLKNNSDNSK